MHPDYTGTPSSFYGVGNGCNHVCPRARTNPAAQPEPEPLVGHPANTMLRFDDVSVSSKLATE